MKTYPPYSTGRSLLTFWIILSLAAVSYSQNPEPDTIKPKKEFRYLFYKKEPPLYTLPDTTQLLDTLSLSDFYDMSLEQLDSIKAIGVSSELEKFIHSLMSVSAKKSMTARDNPAVVTLITEEQIRNSGARDLMELLQMVPGFHFAQDEHGAVGIGIRGNWANEGKVLLMIDGVEMNDNFTARYYFGNHYPANHIKRIEIIRGPGSVIYGGSAEFAVVHVITRSPESLSGLSVTGNVSTMQEGFGRTGGSLYVGKKWDQFQVGFSLAGNYGNRSDRMHYGFYDPYLQDTLGVGNYASMANSSEISHFQSNLYMNYRGLSFRSITDHYQFTDVTRINEDLEYPYRVQIQNTYNDFRYVFRPIPNLMVTPTFTINRRKPREKYTGQGSLGKDTTYITENSTSWRYKFNTVIDYDISHRMSFLGGFEFYNDSYSGSDSLLILGTGDTTIRLYNGSIFGQALFRTAWANFLAGARFEINSQFKSSFVPRIAITKTFNKFHFKIMLSGAHRTPTIGNYYRSYDGTFTVNLDTTGVTAIGHHLDPEKTLVFEAEAGCQLSSNVILMANYFDYTIFDPIVYSYHQDSLIREIFGPNSGMLVYQNFDKSGTRGIELSLNVKDTWGYVLLNYSYYRVKNKPRISAYTVSTFDRDPFLRNEIRDNLLLGFPQHKLNLTGCYYINANFSVNLMANLYSKRYGYDMMFGGDVVDDEGNIITPAKYNVSGKLIEEDPVLLLDFHLNHENFLTTGLHLGVGIKNLLNQRYDYLQPYFGLQPPLPGNSREFYLNISYQLPFKK